MCVLPQNCSIICNKRHSKRYPENDIVHKALLIASFPDLIKDAVTAKVVCCLLSH